MKKEQGKIKVLVIRFSSIGDIVLTTPILRCLKKVRGMEIEVHFVTKKIFAVLLEGNPHVDHLHLLEGQLKDLIRRLKTERFDLIIDLHHNLRSAIVKLALGKPSGNCNKLNFEKWLMTNFKIDRLPNTHLVNRYFEAARIAGVEDDGKGLEFFFPNGTSLLSKGLPLDMNKPYVAFVMGGRHATKRLPNEKIIAICNKLPLEVVLLGGPEDAINGQLIADACYRPVHNGCGVFPLDQSAWVVRHASYVIAHDTGLMHVAAAFNKHMISIWGNTVPAFGMVPYMPENPERSVIAEVKGLPCRPCTKIGADRCPKGHFDCMMKMDVDHIVQIVRSSLMDRSIIEQF